MKVIEDRVLESYGQNFTTQSTITSDPNAPDVAQLELAEVLGDEQLNKVRMYDFTELPQLRLIFHVMNESLHCLTESISMLR